MPLAACAQSRVKRTTLARRLTSPFRLKCGVRGVFGPPSPPQNTPAAQQKAPKDALVRMLY